MRTNWTRNGARAGCARVLAEPTHSRRAGAARRRCACARAGHPRCGIELARASLRRRPRTSRDAATSALIERGRDLDCSERFRARGGLGGSGQHRETLAAMIKLHALAGADQKRHHVRPAATRPRLDAAGSRYHDEHEMFAQTSPAFDAFRRDEHVRRDLRVSASPRITLASALKQLASQDPHRCRRSQNFARWHDALRGHQQTLRRGAVAALNLTVARTGSSAATRST